MELQAQNYTNPQDRGRFGFSMSGEYRAPYKAEPLLVTVLIGLAVGAGVAIFFIFMSFVQKTKREEGDASTFVIIGGAIAFALFVVIMIVIFGFGIRAVKKGFRCTYTANDETFTTTVGGDLHVIRYQEVTNINFEARSSLGKIRGYDVTIKVNGRNEVYSICSDGYLSPNSTPFYIIQERLDIIRRSKSPANINTATANTRGITRAEMERAATGSRSAMDKMAHLLGETSNMPELSAGPTPSQRAISEMERMANTYNYNDPGMPSAGASSRNTDVFTDDRGRQFSMNTTQAQGSFYVKPSGAVAAMFTTLMMLVIGGAVYGLLYFVFTGNLLGMFLSEIKKSKIADYIPLIGALAVQPFVFYFSITRLHGKLYNYRADGRGFFMTVKGGGQEQILYKDVLSVDYKSTKLLWGYRGYKVDILTTYGVVRFDYIFPKFNQRIILKNLPFDIIKRNIPERNNDGAE